MKVVKVNGSNKTTSTYKVNRQSTLYEVRSALLTFISAVLTYVLCNPLVLAYVLCNPLVVVGGVRGVS